MNFSAKALSVFRQAPARLNCAQAVCFGAGREDLLDTMQQCGGGRVEGGTCEALYGAMSVAGADKAEQIRLEFIAACGSDTCKMLKQERKLPCETSVSTASSLLEKYLG